MPAPSPTPWAGFDRETLLAHQSLPRVWARLTDDRPALRDPEHGWRSYRDLRAAVESNQDQLARAGLRAGDRLIISGPASFDLVAHHVAALAAGAIVVPMNTVYTQPEVAHVVHDARPRFALVASAQQREWIAQADRSVALASPVAADGLNFAPAAGGTTGELPTAGDLALLCYTSGTTGRPKGAALSHGNLLASAEAVRLAWEWTAQDRLLLALPLFHVHGLCVGLHGTLLASASAVLQPSFEAASVLDAIRSEECSLFFGVPTMYDRLVNDPRAAALGRLRLCVSGSAPLSPRLAQQISAFTTQPVLERYGMSETLMLTSNPYDGERRPGSVGFPFPGVEVRLGDGDGGGDADGGGGDVGEVLVKGPNVFGGYWENDQATRESFRDGWFRTGDLGRLDEDGYLHLVGRAKELIISGGYNVYPAEVEAAITQHSGVSEAAVVGLPSDRWGETVTAFIVSRDPAPTAAELTQFVEPLLAPYKRPRSYRFVEALPKNALGKIVRGQLTAAPDGPPESV